MNAIAIAKDKWWILAGIIAFAMIFRKIGFWMVKVQNATFSPITLYNGQQTRRLCDSGGCGNYGARRTRADGVGTHNGQDILCTPGAQVRAPYAGKIIGLSTPYATDNRYSGVKLQVNAALLIKIMYMQPLPGIVGKEVQAGEVLGHCQNISLKYGAAVPAHLHIETHELGIPVNPEPYIFKA